MKNPTVKRSIHERVFNEVTIHRASLIYRKNIDFRLQKLSEAMEAENADEISTLKVELNRLRENLLELGNVTVQEENLSSITATVVRLTRPVDVSTIKKRKDVFTPENVQRALTMYHGYVNVNLDLLSSAMKEGDKDRAEEVRCELEALRKNICDLEGVHF